MAEKIKYLLGIDGGGTKTEFLLTDLNGNEIRRIFLGTSNPVNTGIENAKDILKQGIDKICNGLDFSSVSVFAGLSGGGSHSIKAEISSFLSSFGFGAYLCGSDADSAVELAVKGENGAAVIMGTGIIAFARADGELHRIGGRGFMIDKGTSGFCLGSEALNAAFEFLDKRGESRIICELVEKKLGKSPETAVSEIYTGGVSFVASFAPVIFEAYKKGDKTAEEILDRNIRESVKLIKAAQSYLKKGEKTVITGGLCKQRDILMHFFNRYLNSDFPLIFSDEPTVNGAVHIAKTNIQGA